MANPRPVDSGVFVGFDVSGALDAWKLPEVSGLFGGLDALKSPSVSAAAGLDVSAGLNALKLPEVSGLFGGLDALKPLSVSAVAGLDVSGGLDAWKLPEVSGSFGGLDALKPLSVSAVAGLDVSGGLDAWKLPEVSGSFGGLDALKPLSVSAVAGLDVSGGLDGWKLPEVSGSFGGLDALKPLSVSAAVGLDVSGGLDGWKLPEVGGLFGGLDALKPLSVSVRSSLHRRAMRYIGGPSSRSRPSGYALEDTPPPQPVGVVEIDAFLEQDARGTQPGIPCAVPWGDATQRRARTRLVDPSRRLGAEALSRRASHRRAGRACVALGDEPQATDRPVRTPNAPHKNRLALPIYSEREIQRVRDCRARIGSRAPRCAPRSESR